MFFLGPPGSGKGTQARLLAKRLSLPHISTGDLSREEMSRDTREGVEIRRAVNAGDLVSTAITVNLLKKRLKKDDCRGGFILEGFPRKLDQAKPLDDFLLEKKTKS